jgi:hypothetical protein
MGGALETAWEAYVNWPYLVPSISLVFGLGLLISVMNQQKAGRTFAGITFYRDKSPFRFWLHQVVFGCMAFFLTIMGIVGFSKLMLPK